MRRDSLGPEGRLRRSLDDPLQFLDRPLPEVVLLSRSLEEDVGRVAQKEDEVGEEGAERRGGEEEVEEGEEGGGCCVEGGRAGRGETRRWEV